MKWWHQDVVRYSTGHVGATRTEDLNARHSPAMPRAGQVTEGMAAQGRSWGQQTDWSLQVCRIALAILEDEEGCEAQACLTLEIGYCGLHLQSPASLRARITPLESFDLLYPEDPEGEILRGTLSARGYIGAKTICCDGLGFTLPARAHFLIYTRSGLRIEPASPAPAPALSPPRGVARMQPYRPPRHRDIVLAGRG